jgi:hypothetical protein
MFCYTELRDTAGTIVPNGKVPIFFGTTGQCRLIGHNPILSEAGTATILLDSSVPNPTSAVYAVALIKEGDQTRIMSTAAAPDGSRVADFKICYTTDGTEPSASAAVYFQPVRTSGRLRAAILVGGQVVASVDSDASAHSTSDKSILTAEAAFH